jgi:hypothetical protein
MATEQKQGAYKKPVSPESTIESSPRRNFIRKAALATAAVGVGGVLLGKNVVPESSAACTKSCIVIACNSVVVDNAGLNRGILPCCDINAAHALTFGPTFLCSRCGTTANSGQGIASAVAAGSPNLCGLDFYTNYKKRMSITNSGLVGIGTCSPSSTLEAVSSANPIGRFVNNASSGDRTALVLFQNGDSSPTDWNVGVAGACNPLKIPDGSFYIQAQVHLGNPAALVINKSGSVGIDTASTPTTLRVNGSVSAKLISKTGSSTLGSYAMTTYDFAVLVNAGVLPTGATTFTVTLPPAKTAAGMLVFIKKTDTSTHSVTVARNGTDTIEGKNSIPLKMRFDSLRLISNGSNEWYILGNSQCGKFVF